MPSLVFQRQASFSVKLSKTSLPQMSSFGLTCLHCTVKYNNGPDLDHMVTGTEDWGSLCGLRFWESFHKDMVRVITRQGKVDWK